MRHADKVVTLTAYRHPGRHEDEESFAAATTTAMRKLGTSVGELCCGPVEKAPLPGPDPSEA